MKKLLTYLILAIILILASCTAATTDPDTPPTTPPSIGGLNGACNFKIYDNSGAERVSADGTCKAEGNTLTMDFNSPVEVGSTQKAKKVVIDSTAKTLTITFEDDTATTQSSSTSNPITVTTKTDYWEVYIDGKLNTKVTAK